MTMTEKQRKRYSRHIVLPYVGETGQEKLLSGKVLVIGAGGLGSPVTMYLAAAGVGTLGLVDYDAVDLSNLQRQILHQTKDAGRAKTVSARETVTAMNPDVAVHTYNERLNNDNIGDIIQEQNYDFIIDATDNFAAKFLINDACVRLQKPFSHAGVLGWEGQVMTYVPSAGPCYRCIFKEPPPPDAVLTCRQGGILGVICGVIGSIQATEALKYLTGAGELLTGCLLTYNALTMNFRKVRLPADKNCAACGENVL